MFDRRVRTFGDEERVIRRIRALSSPLRESSDLDLILERIGSARYVLLGEASHGTSEFYTWRRMISERLIQEQGFSFIAVEGDWPDCYQVNRYVRHLASSSSSARDVLRVFGRWPTWMWANEEIVGLVGWLHAFNADRPQASRVGFFGLDVYSLWDSLHEIDRYFKRNNPEARGLMGEVLRCFEPYGYDERAYARATSWLSASCEGEVIAVLQAMRERARAPHNGDTEGIFNAEQNALIAANAEAYYRAMVRPGAESWNIRDRHMVETLERLMTHHGNGARAIVWEHNTHIGDARATDMAREGMVNVGQLVRERHGDEGVVSIGFGSHRGSVIASDAWGNPMNRMVVPPAAPGSYEDLFHRAEPDDAMLILDDLMDEQPFLTPRGHRAIGVVYHPEYEHHGNYVPTVLPFRYDIFLFIDETEALHPLELTPRVDPEMPETYPSGM